MENGYDTDAQAVLRRGLAVVRSPKDLRLHPALETLGWECPIEELNRSSRMEDLSASEPLLIASNGVILAGFGIWRYAILRGLLEIECIEYPMDDCQSLQVLVAYQRPRRPLNAFVRITLALTLQSHFEQKARENRVLGGKCKGLAKLPEAQRVQVRKQIGDIAGAGQRNVANVKRIWDTAHPRLIEALIAGQLKINRAILLCNSSKAVQLEQFTQECEDRETYRVIRKAISRREGDGNSLDPNAVLEALLQQERRQPGSVVIRIGRLQRTVILMRRDSSPAQISQGKLNPV